MTESFSGRDPDVVALKTHAQDVVMGGCALNRNSPHFTCCAAHEHLRFMGIERGTVDRPVRAVVVCETFVCRKPGTIGVDSFDLVQEVARQTAVFGEEVVPVAAIVAA